MADISTGRQRGIVPFVDETTGRLPDQYIPQRIIDLQGNLEQAVTNASTSATSASQSASQAQSSATAANSSAQAASASSESARTASDSATSSKDAAARSASQASASAQAAETSKTNAAASAQAAETSKTNAASSASAAKISETNAAASATAAQQAVDGFGLEVGTTTTGNSGTDAAVTVQKNGTKYTANFTIPRGDKGEPASVEHDDTLAGNGTINNALSVIGSFKNATKIEGTSSSLFDPNNYNKPGVYFVTIDRDASNIANIPTGLNDRFIRAALVVCKCGTLYGNDIAQLWLNRSGGYGEPFISYRILAEVWHSWQRLAFVSDIPDVSALTSRIATLESKLNELAVMQTRLEALEARINSLETNQ